ncbi:MAG TPA: N-acetyltransferase [Pseudomonas sp.]|nr:N-acetyltransferase [Pseudomonas sp.]
MSLTIRLAQARDAAQVVPLIHSSGPAAFERVFKHGALDAQGFLQHAFVTPRTQFSHARHWLVEQDGQVLAAGTAYSGVSNLRDSLQVLRQMVASYGLLGACTPLARGLQMEMLVRPPARDVWYLAHLGVRPELRGQGIGERLIQHLLEQGRAAGYRQTGLDVAASNPRAQKLYERLGFTVQVERISHIPGVADHRYMARAL